jgi:hypothetical protein
MPVWGFRLRIFVDTGNCLFHGILKSSIEAGDRALTEMVPYTQNQSKVREYYNAVCNPQMRIYGTNIRKFENKWQREDKYW